MKGKIVFLSTALAGALAAASAAHAVDVKVYPGNACQPRNGGQAADFSTSTFSISNTNAADRKVVCPIVRDNHKNLNGIKSVVVRVESSGGKLLTCFLESYTATGNFVEDNAKDTTSGQVTNLTLSIDTSTKGGTYSVACTLPQSGEVLGYQVTEF